MGPLRFNLSKSGVGLSAGVKGLRIGTGPRGNYVHMGRGGIYYRKTIPSGRRQRTVDLRDTGVSAPSASDPTVGAMVEIDSSDVAGMVDSSSSELLQEINEKKRRVRFGPIVLVLAALCAIGLVPADLPLSVQIGCGGACLIAIYLAFRRDAMAKTVVLFYQFDPSLERVYDAVHRAASTLAECNGHWHISGSAKVYDRKYHAGASALVERKATKVAKGAPHFLKTNIATVSIGVGRQTMFLFPDRVLLYDYGKVGVIGYDQLSLSVTQTRFVEDSAPADARVVGQTWRYVNKNGGPDRRFSNNRQLPICLYDEIHFTSTSGLNEIVQASRCGVGDTFRNAIEELSVEVTRARLAAANVPMCYRVGKNGEDIGELSRGDIQRRLASGELLCDDYFFDVGTQAWVPLDRLPHEVSDIRVT